MAQMSFKMFNQNFQQAYYGANLYGSYFFDDVEVKKNVISLITTDAATQ